MVNIGNGPYVIDNFLKEDILSSVNNIFKTTGWQYCNQASPESFSKFWIQKYYHNSSPHEKTESKAELNRNIHVLNNVIFNQIKKVFKRELLLLRVHANGQTYGQDGDWHEDVGVGYNSNTYSCIIYMTPNINNENAYTYGGCTQIKIDKSILSIEPVYNRAVIFKSINSHRGLCFNREITDLRISLSFIFDVL
jgi:hypothetical protein